MQEYRVAIVQLVSSQQQCAKTQFELRLQSIVMDYRDRDRDHDHGHHHLGERSGRSKRVHSILISPTYQVNAANSVGVKDLVLPLFIAHALATLLADFARTLQNAVAPVYTSSMFLSLLVVNKCRHTMYHSSMTEAFSNYQFQTVNLKHAQSHAVSWLPLAEYVRNMIRCCDEQPISEQTTMMLILFILAL